MYYEAPLHLPCGQEITEIREENDHFGLTLNRDNRMVNSDVENSSSSKKRKLKSRVWNDFIKYEDEDGKEWAECNHCKKKFVGSSKSGTTHLKNHLERCPSKLRNPGGGAVDKTGDCLATTISANFIKGKSKIDEELNQLDGTRMIIKYWGASLVSLKDDILNVFKEEKQKLMRYFHKLPCRFNVSIEYLGDDVGKFYVGMHFIDDNWELKQKVIYVHIEDEDDYRGWYEKLKCMVKDWNIDKDICSIVDHLSFHKLFVGLFDTEKCVRELKGSLPLAGAFLHLHLLVDCLRSQIRWEDCSWIMDRMIPLVEYVRKIKSSEGNNGKFEKAVDKAAAKSMGIKLPLPPTDGEDFKWGEWGMGLKEVFWELQQMDDAFEPINLTEEEWKLLEFWKELKDAADSLCGCKYTTPNVYFSKICHLYMTLLQWEKSDINVVCLMASEVRNNHFHEYWNISYLVLAITVVLDPRFKMDIVERWYVEIYGKSANAHINEVIDEITNIYKEYAKATESPKTSAMLDPMGRPCASSYQVDHIASSTQSELDRYLKDTKFPAVEDFDILAWWSANSTIYPTLARMVRDYLALPIGVEKILGSSFENEILNAIANRGLDDDIKKALVHTKIWLYDPEK